MPPGPAAGLPREAIRRIAQDQKKIKEDFPAEDFKRHKIKVQPAHNDCMQLWLVRMNGPELTMWSTGCFYLLIEYTAEYPNSAPKVKFIGKVPFHPNVYTGPKNNGDICLNMLQRDWSPVYSTVHVIVSVRSLLDAPNTDSPANPRAAQLYEKDPAAYRQEVRECCEDSWAVDEWDIRSLLNDALFPVMGTRPYAEYHDPKEKEKAAGGGEGTIVHQGKTGGGKGKGNKQQTYRGEMRPLPSSLTEEEMQDAEAFGSERRAWSRKIPIPTEVREDKADKSKEEEHSGNLKPERKPHQQQPGRFDVGGVRQPSEGTKKRKTKVSDCDKEVPLFESAGRSASSSSGGVK
uniref:UBC core domain-containing protein n=1 Tax=Chromera velia CCMP2878 TaxID=1169474 RepID=A0A0G4HAB9_9ALVE|mmetsp:Transcript_26484/g.51997  ORF Transcript_26484/g.51997 Transcript_26484/m.51997 type:complete len:347 (+) Transcript_26484:407-1447(+)|eukprot:Cvel_25670.t1-p1 / transcript=Cvel_25670.t1 / gene=Cvel_25670 / organism=Chromera_velia_CCMP2878 / gene_product=Ubiquitin-conjugating enzyme E2 A, putative / transcript_product=Ubiquitin-conjugating enzyme E2 A, putative / location=Cvel_scaffold2941:15116-19720(-) / protein_length=346 / sequence_SO=supercontig / SO=protein_coding / is_pseudo=false